MSLTEEQRADYLGWVDLVRRGTVTGAWAGTLPADTIVCVADHLAEVEAALAAEWAKVARLREAIGEMTLTTDLKKIGEIGFAVLDETEATS